MDFDDESKEIKKHKLIIKNDETFFLCWIIR